MKSKTFTTTAKVLHWATVVLVFYQLSSGFWMTSAIRDVQLRAIAWKVYQNHKSVGITILLITLFRIWWRVGHPAPSHEKILSLYERLASKAAHYTLYALLVISPLLGWAMVSTSPLKLPTLLFDYLHWPHIPWLERYVFNTDIYVLSKRAHEISAITMTILVSIHIIAALKHHIIDKNTILQGMLFTKDGEKK